MKAALSTIKNIFTFFLTNQILINSYFQVMTSSEHMIGTNLIVITIAIRVKLFDFSFTKSFRLENQLTILYFQITITPITYPHLIHFLNSITLN